MVKKNIVSIVVLVLGIAEIISTSIDAGAANALSWLPSIISAVAIGVVTADIIANKGK